MSCGCKTNVNYEPNNDGSEKKINLGFTNIIVKILAFSFMMLLLPVIMLAIIWFIFELIILNKEVDIKRVVKVLSSKIKPFNEGFEEDDEEEDEEDDDEFTEENYEMIDVEDITPVRNK